MCVRARVPALTRTRLQDAAFDSEVFLSRVVHGALDAATADAAASSDKHAFEHLELLTRELQRCALARPACDATLAPPERAKCLAECGTRSRSGRAACAHTSRSSRLQRRRRRTLTWRVPRAPACTVRAALTGPRAARQASVSSMSASCDALLVQFGVLDDRVARVGRTAAHIGDRLANVDSARRRAETAVDLISALSLFDTDGAPALGPLFTDDNRLPEAAALTNRLLALAESGAAAGLPSCARALARLQTYANGLENRLVARFDAAGGKQDVAGMAAAAAVLTSFNGGASCVARFVATRPMFLTMGLGEDASPSDTPPATEAEALSAATAVVRVLGVQFRDLLRDARDDAATVTAVFPAPSVAMSTLVQRLLEQRVRSALESTVPPLLPPEASAAAAAPPRLARLLVLAGAYERTMELATRLAALPGCGGAPLDAVAAADELFVTWRDRYLDDELMTQRGLGEGDSFGIAGAEARLARAGDALTRCELLVRAPAARAAAAAALVHALCVDIIRHMRSGLDGACAAVASRTKTHTAATPGVTAVGEGAGALLDEAGRACRVVHALQQHLADSAAPLLVADPGARAAAADSARQAGIFIEAALANCLQCAVAAAAAAAERTLAHEQSKADFSPKTVGNSGDAPDAPQLAADRPTVACMRVVALLERVHAAASAALDAHNCLALSTSLAGRLLSMLEAHLLGFLYTPAGGLRLKRDLAEYGTLLAAWGVPQAAAPQRRLAELGALVNILIAPRPALASLLHGEGLGVAVQRPELLRWLALRGDYRKNEKAYAVMVTAPV